MSDALVEVPAGDTNDDQPENSDSDTLNVETQPSLLKKGGLFGKSVAMSPKVGDGTPSPAEKASANGNEVTTSSKNGNGDANANGDHKDEGENDDEVMVLDDAEEEPAEEEEEEDEEEEPAAAEEPEPTEDPAEAIEEPAEPAEAAEVPAEVAAVEEPVVENAAAEVIDDIEMEDEAEEEDEESEDEVDNDVSINVVANDSIVVADEAEAAVDEAMEEEEADETKEESKEEEEEDDEDDLNVSTEDGGKQQADAKKVPALTCEEVMHILKHNPDVQQTRDAFEAVRRLLSKSKNPPVDEVISCGLITELVRGLSSQHPEIPHACAFSLRIITSGTTEQTAEVVNHDAIDPLIQLMMHADVALAEQATFAIANIAYEAPQFRDFVIQSSGVEALMVLCGKIKELTSSFVRTLAWTFLGVCRHHTTHAQLPVVEVLLKGLLILSQYRDYNVRKDACRSVSHLTAGPDAGAQISLAFAAGFMPRVYKHLSEDDGLVAHALRVLGNMAMHSDSMRAALVHLDTLCVLPAVMHKAKSSSIVKECCWLISIVTAGTPTQIQSVIDNGLLVMLVTIMQTGDYRCQFECSWALANLVRFCTRCQLLALVDQAPIGPLIFAIGDRTDYDFIINNLNVVYKILSALPPRRLVRVQRECRAGGVPHELLGVRMRSQNREVHNMTYKILDEFF